MTTQELTGPDAGLAPAPLPRYAVVRDGDEGRPAETYPRTEDGLGAIQAVNHAARLSLLERGACTVYRPDGRVLVRYVHGRRAGRQ